MMAETSVCVNNGELAGFPRNFSIFSMPIPEILSHEEIVVSNLSSEGSGGNVEDSLSSVEVIHISGYLGRCNFPSWMVTVAVDRTQIVEPGLIEPLNRFDVIFLTHRND